MIKDIFMKKIISLILAIAMILSFTLALSSCGKEYYFVEMSVKDCGKMVILLDRGTAPITVDNFLSLVSSGFYDGLTFHRIIEGFVIQGGDPDGDGRGGSDTTIKGEFEANGHKNDIQHVEGVISMARTSGDRFNNYGYDTATSQFFICNADARASLDGLYAAFGWVVEGMDVVHKITNLGINTDSYYNGVITDINEQPVIEYIKILEDYKYYR